MYSIARRRNLVGTSIDMSIHTAQILEVPNGKRDLARRAIATGFKVDPTNYTNLCSDVNDGLYMDELVKFFDKNQFFRFFTLELFMGYHYPIIGYIPGVRSSKALGDLRSS